MTVKDVIMIDPVVIIKRNERAETQKRFRHFKVLETTLLPREVWESREAGC